VKESISEMDQMRQILLLSNYRIRKPHCSFVYVATITFMIQR